MIITMKRNAKLKEISSTIRILETAGAEPVVSRRRERTIIGIPRGVPNMPEEKLNDLPGVEEIRTSDHPFKLVSRQFQSESTIIRVGNNKIGNSQLCVMAGLCSVESWEQVRQTAEYCKKAGVTILRGGAFKPRSSPYSFQGLGEEGLKLLAEAGKEAGLPVVTEVLTTETVGMVARYADVLQIGARNMQNFKLLEAVGRCGKPVLLKRGMNATIKEFLLAAEYIYANGTSEIILCERGIRTFETYTRNTLDISAVPALKELSHLPVIVDPSHASGRREMILALSKAALAAGADGLMIETHPAPEKALSDGPQSLDQEQFEAAMSEIARFHDLLNKR